ncbi:hypothetical protein [Lampropedia aestuarii]|uniref:hypothetical protein n=1 Tax=Lampropedia aestuarii TaxID=2562762 RepID=UPI002468D299|nr:hypothetical protein [Lampropedia aestuarii]MDH5857961.1 hypothetical protein [Lampropedia aestuarii]
MASTTTPVIFKNSVPGSAAKAVAGLLLTALVTGPLIAQTQVVSERLVSDPQVNAANTSNVGQVQGAEVLPEGEPATARSAVRSYQQDAGSRIEELRVRGQTREITVTPSGTMPSYEVVPGNSQTNPISSGRSQEGTNGPRRWKIGEF